jgi:hypothetical protein
MELSQLRAVGFQTNAQTNQLLFTFPHDHDMEIEIFGGKYRLEEEIAVGGCGM